MTTATARARAALSSATTLYRFYDADGALLYIGITNSVPRRFDQHQDRKPWWGRVASVRLEHYDGRTEALDAEKAAILAERPQFNVRHNGANARRHPRSTKPGRWRFYSLRSGHMKQVDLVLYPELDCSSMVDEVGDLDGESQMEEYLRYIEARHPTWLASDAVPIHWTVHSNWWGVIESAPFQSDMQDLPDFLSYFTWPEDRRTGEPIDWFRLPVVMDRFPDFAAALGWMPSALQSTCPLRSIIRSREALG